MSIDAERLQSAEVVLGEYETIKLPVVDFVRLPQVRSDKNPELANIKESIRTRGLINPIDVARMDMGQLADYIDFVNRVWGTSVDPEDYVDNIQPDGFVYVVVAGHTRAEAIYQNQQEDESGRIHVVTAKVHNISSPEELISLQLDENLHSKPAQEQRAIAIVETYFYGLESDIWSNQAEFLKVSKGKFSNRILSEAIKFASLPPEVRDFVFAGHIPYSVGVELGRAADTIRRYADTMLHSGVDDDQKDEVKAAEYADMIYRTKIGLIIAQIQNRSLNGPAAKKYIKGRVDEMKRQMGEHEDDGNELFSLDLISLEDQYSAYQKGQMKEYRDLMRLMKRQSVDSVEGVMKLHGELIGVDDEFGELVEELAIRQSRLLGGRALQETVAV